MSTDQPGLAVGLLSVLLITNFSACSKVDQDGNDLTDRNPKWPDRLRMAYALSVEEPEAMFTHYHDLGDYVGSVVGIPVEVFETSGGAPMIEAMRSGQIDIGSVGPFAYLIASEKAAVEPLVTWGFRNGVGGYTPGCYRSVLVVKPNSVITTMDDLRQKAGELTFAFNHAASASGHLVPMSGLEDFGINAESDFKRVVYAQSHLNTIMTVVSGRVDVGAIQENAFERLIDKGRLERTDLRVIWRSEPILRGPVIARKALPQTLIEAVQRAFLEMETRNPKLFKERFSVAGTQYEDQLTYIPATDSMWDPLRRIAHSIENMRLLESKPIRIQESEDPNSPVNPDDTM